MSAPAFEIVLARLYTDTGFRECFLREPELALKGYDLTVSEKRDLTAIDRTGLVMAAHSFQGKKRNRIPPRGKIKSRLERIIGRIKSPWKTIANRS